MDGMIPEGLLSPQQMEQLQQQRTSDFLLALGAGLAQTSQGMGRRPSTLAGITAALPGAVQAQRSSFDQTLQQMLRAQQIQDAQRQRAQQAQQQQQLETFVSGLPESEQARFRAFPTQAAEAMFREPKGTFRPLSSAEVTQLTGYTPKPGEAFQMSPDGEIKPVVRGERGPLVQNILGGKQLTPGQKRRDEKAAEDIYQWQSGGGQDMVAQIAQLKPVIEDLEAKKPITGVGVAIQPDILLAMTNPEALQSRELVEEVVQRNLRAVLGAQFTEKEGDRLISRAFNPKLRPEENAKRVRRLFLQMSSAAEQKQAMADYFDEFGTLRGFKGKMPTIQDFYNAMEGDAGTMQIPAGGNLMDAARRELERRGVK
jgi:type II secretory pathway pseudopilin PulG